MSRIEWQAALHWAIGTRLYHQRVALNSRKSTRLGDARTLGGIGSILLLIPGVNIVGYILILIAGKYISDELADKSIFNDLLYAVVTGIIGAAAGIVILVTGAIFSVFTLGVSAFLGTIGGLAVTWVFFIISSIFIRRAFDAMGTKLNVSSFKTAGTLYFFGVLLTIILVGFLLLFIAFIFQIIAFFSISSGPGPTPAQSMAAPVAQGAMKFCPSCGTQMESSVLFCPRCGAKQPA